MAADRPFYMPVHVAETLALFEGVTDEEFGAAMRLLLRAWLASEPPLSMPADEPSLARIRVGGRLASQAEREVVLRGWTLGNDERMHHHDMRRMYDDARNRQTEASRKGRKGAAARWKPPDDACANAPAMPVPCPSYSNTQSKPKPQNQSEPKPPPTPLAEPPPAVGGGRSVYVPPPGWESHPANHDPNRVREIIAAYPKASGRSKAVEAVRDALVRVRKGSDPFGPHPPPSDAAAWLLGRVVSFAESGLVRSLKALGRDQFIPDAWKWFADAKYTDDDGAWKVVTEQDAKREKLDRILEAM